MVATLGGYVISNSDQSVTRVTWFTRDRWLQMATNGYQLPRQVSRTPDAMRGVTVNAGGKNKKAVLSQSPRSLARFSQPFALALRVCDRLLSSARRR